MAAASRSQSSCLGLQDSSGVLKHPNSTSGGLFHSSSAGGCGRYSSGTTDDLAFAFSSTSAFASSSTSAFAATPASTFCSRSVGFLNQPAASPTRIKLVGTTSGSQGDSVAGKCCLISAAASAGSAGGGPPRKTCMCSPTTHPGSFRCSLHKGLLSHRQAAGNHAVSSSLANRLNARRSAMTNSLVRIGTVEGEWVKRTLATLIRPSSHQQRRRAAFHPQPSRLSVMCRGEKSSV